MTLREMHRTAHRVSAPAGPERFGINHSDDGKDVGWNAVHAVTG
ncbi:hypothetical protein [Streptomyces antibioticus]|nr:hypothetical protein [Streptomyces antibioticus]